MLLLAAAGFWYPTRAAESPDPVQGDQIFAIRCASCHAKPEGRTPGVEALSKRTPEEIVSALRFGSMREQAQGLPLMAIQSIAVHRTGRAPVEAGPMAPEPNPCPPSEAAFHIAPSDWNGWSPDATNARFQSNPALSLRDVPRLRLKWAFGFHGSSVYGQPVVV